MSVILRKKKLLKGKYSLYLDVYHNGERSYEFLKLYLNKDKKINKETLELAENIRAKRQLEIQSSEYGFIPRFKRKANFIDYFERLTKERNFDKNWKSTLMHLKEYTKGSRVSFSSIDEKWVEGFQKYLLKKISPNTAFTKYSVLKASLNQAVIDKIIISNPCVYAPKIKKTETERIYLTLDEIKKIVKTDFKYPEIKKAFLFACFTGLRYSDLSKLTWGDIKHERGRYNIKFSQTKTSGFEYLPLSKSAVNIIRSNSENIIQFPNTKVFSPGSMTWMNKKLKELGKKAGVKKRISTHTARHTFATLSLTQDVDIYRVSKLLGHKNLSNTQIYAKIIDERLNEAVDLLPEIEVK